jgi:hypothetical protein
LGWMEMSRLHCCCGCSSRTRASSQRGSIDWNINGVNAQGPPSLSPNVLLLCLEQYQVNI